MMIEQLYLLLEILAYLLIINDLFNKKFKLNFPAVITVAAEVILFTLIKEEMIPDIFLIVPYILIFFYCKLEFDSKIRVILLNMILTFMSLGVLQLIVGSFSFLCENKETCALIINALDYIIVFFLVKNRVLIKLLTFIKENSNILFRIIFYGGILFLFLVICYRILGRFTFLEYFLIVVMYILLIGMVKIWKKEHEKLIYKISELNTFNEFRIKEKKLYKDIRKRQHEFKKQINALYSTHYTCTTYEELVNAQSKYADKLIKDNKYNDLLLSCKPCVLAGFIYSQLEHARNQGIKIQYSVFVEDMDDADREYDYICVFGILFDNALEALQNCQNIEQKIKCVLMFDGLHTKLEIANVSKYIKNEEINKWFGENFSTKNKNRGYGLNNIIDIKNKYNADIIVNNIVIQEENWISVQFIID